MMQQQEQNYTISDGRRMKRCPKCKRYKIGTGSVCMCGYKWRNENKTTKETKHGKVNVAKCKLCNMPGDYGGFCKLHWEMQAEKQSNKRLESYRVPGKNDYEIDVLTRKIITKPKQEEAEYDNDNKSVGRESKNGDSRGKPTESNDDRDEIPF